MENKSQISNLKSGTQIKVCGLTQLTQINELINLNVDFLGFIFYEKSPRYVLNHLSVREIAEINHQGKVGVFVNENIESVTKISTEAQLDFIQLHGDENEEYFLKLKDIIGENIKIIKVIRVGTHKTQLESEIKKISNLKSQISYLLFDTDSKSFGGTGKSFDWNLLNEIEIPKPYFLSGGISTENINEMKLLNNQPFAVDINSKFEMEPGIKNVERIKDFQKKLIQ